MTPEIEENRDTGILAPRRFRALADYQAQYPDPISVSAGETFQVSEKADAWNGNPDWLWIWCTDPRGKQGWVPKTIITFNPDGKTGVARASYSATELTVAAGEELIAHQEESGWLWCTNQQGNSGWVPLEYVTPQTVQ